MTFRCTRVPPIALVAALLGASVSAHHSLASQFDESRPLTLQGVITQVEWVNPHVYLHIDVKDKNGTSE
jgi:hypothetical protein